MIASEFFNKTESLEKISLALAENRFCLYAQPIVALQPDCDRQEFQTKRCFEHYEIYPDFKKQSEQFAASNIFLPDAENYNLMIEIDRWVISNFLTNYKAYCEQQRQYKLKLPTKVYNINLSEASINSYQIDLFLQKQLESYTFPEKTICFAITESALLSNIERIIALIKSLKNLGCLIALDNFGKEISSLNCLKKLSIDYLKIDGGLIKNIDNDAVDYAAVECLSHISQVMKIKTIAKDIEDQCTTTNLEKIGINYGQGQAIAKSRPLSFI